jgi:hypothetical protein
MDSLLRNKGFETEWGMDPVSPVLYAGKEFDNGDRWVWAEIDLFIDPNDAPSMVTLNVYVICQDEDEGFGFAFFNQMIQQVVTAVKSSGKQLGTPSVESQSMPMAQP